MNINFVFVIVIVAHGCNYLKPGLENAVPFLDQTFSQSGSRKKNGFIIESNLMFTNTDSSHNNKNSAHNTNSLFGRLPPIRNGNITLFFATNEFQLAIVSK